MKESASIFLTPVLLASLAVTASADTILENLPSGQIAWSPFGEPNTSTVGQTFMTPDAVDTRLDSFTFWLDHLADYPDAVEFRPYVAVWNGHGITGAPLFSGGVFSVPFDTDDDFDEFTFNTGGINLVAGQQYVAFISAAGLFDGDRGTGRMASHDFTDVYAFGHFVFDPGEGAFPGPDWSFCNSSCADAAFRFVFSEATPVPEPAVFHLLGLGGLGWLGMRRRRLK